MHRTGNSAVPTPGPADAFEWCFRSLMAVEGGYSNHKSDSGGKTRWGVTEALARRHGYAGDMREYPIELARDVARVEFWIPLQGGSIAPLSRPIIYELFDTGYNAGPGVAAKFLQRSLNVLNRQARDYPDLKVDGAIGPVTVENLRSYLAFRGNAGELVLLKMLNSLQGAFYVGLAEERGKDEDFVFGWFTDRVRIPG